MALKWLQILFLITCDFAFTCFLKLTVEDKNYRDTIQIHWTEL